MRRKPNNEEQTNMNEETLERLAEVTQIVDKLSTQVNFIIKDGSSDNKSGITGFIIKIVKKYGVYSSIIVGAVSVSWYISSFINDIYQFTEVSYKKIDNIVLRQEGIAKEIEVILNNQDLVLRKQDQINMDIIINNQNSIKQNQEKIINLLSSVDKTLLLHTSGDKK